MKLFDQKHVKDELSSGLCKSGFILILLCLMLSIKASAQNDSAIQKDTTKKTIILDGPVKSQAQPLIVLNGKTYHGSMESINPDDIVRIDVLKGENATTLYGAQAQNGVLLIKTKNQDSHIFKDEQTVSPSTIGKDSTANKDIKH